MQNWRYREENENKGRLLRTETKQKVGVTPIWVLFKKELLCRILDFLLDNTVMVTGRIFGTELVM